MNYIVFDLEWNQCPYGKIKENKRLPFEIIEIGAVKLNESKEIIGRFHEIIRPQVYKRIHFRTGEIINLTMDELNRGKPFAGAAESFFEWSGEDARFCTWGTLDLVELQRNLEFYDMEELLPGPLFYEDVQKLFAIFYEDKKIRRSLEFAAEYLGIKASGEFHSALTDATYTAKILATIPDYIIKENFSVDCYRNPRSKKEQLTVRFRGYEKFISREFPTKEDVMMDKEITRIQCFQCHKNVRQIVKWFTEGGKNHLAVGLCEEHGYVKSRIHIRKSVREEGYYAVKNTKMISSEDALRIREKQMMIRDKRLKKKRKKED